MLNNSIRILDFDHSVASQEKVISRFSPEIIDLSGLGPSVRLWMNAADKAKIAEKIRGRKKNSLTFFGSGDFHHITHVLLEQFQEPLTLIVFDFHSDWDTRIPRFGCGAWVSRALEQKNILKCVLIGPSSEDLSWPNLQSGNLKALEAGRLEIYPYEHQPSFVFLKKVPESICLKKEGGFLGAKIYWEELKGKDPAEFFSSLARRLPSRQVYVSLDKDCLKKEYSLTNWEEGRLSLDELLAILKAIKENLDIIGMDICGDYSPVHIKSKIKNFFSNLDHPKSFCARGSGREEINRLNEAANLKILECLGL
jgi:hypothetical protein